MPKILAQELTVQEKLYQYALTPWNAVAASAHLTP